MTKKSFLYLILATLPCLVAANCSDELQRAGASASSICGNERALVSLPADLADCQDLRHGDNDACQQGVYLGRTRAKGINAASAERVMNEIYSQCSFLALGDSNAERACSCGARIFRLQYREELENSRRSRPAIPVAPPEECSPRPGIRC